MAAAVVAEGFVVAAVAATDQLSEWKIKKWAYSAKY